ncbi:MAG: SDR family NAD(P)-dependent oxidoreductase [Candidatus Nanopelagicales bacterium]
MTDADLTGRRAIVTGASGTFGQAITAALRSRGARVVGLDLVPSEDPDAPVLACDVTDQSSVESACAAAVELLGGLDLLVNNAGIGGPAPAGSAPDEVVSRQLEINLLGTWRVTAALLPALVESRGRVVMVASRMAVMPLPLAAAYGVSKRAMVAYADALRLEYAPYVTVTTVYPSMVRSPIHDSTAAAGLSLEGVSHYEPLEGVVDTIVTACAARRPRRDMPTSPRGRVEFFLGRHLPALTDRIVLKTLAGRVAAGAFDHAPIADGLVQRYRALTGSGR